MSKKILIIDDHRLVLDALAIYLGQESNIEVTCTEDRDDALNILHQNGAFDVVIVDLKMPGISGINGLPELIAANNGNPVVVMSGQADLADLVALHYLGVRRFLKKNTPARELVKNVEAILNDPEFIPQVMRLDIAERIPPDLVGVLSLAECHLLCLVAMGATNASAADTLGTTPAMVSNQLTSIYKKLGVATRTEAANFMLGHSI